MPTTKNRDTQHKLARLKKIGLYKGNARKRPTKYGKFLVKKYSDVLSGEAAVISAPSYGEARRYRSETGNKLFRVSRNKIVVKKKKGETFKYDKRSKAVVSYSKEYGQKVKRIKLPGVPENVNEILPKKRGKKYRYAIPFGSGPNGYRHREETWEGMVQFMQPYEQSTSNPYQNWQEYIEIEEYESDEANEDDV